MRSRSPSLASTLPTWVLTVCSLITSSAAISALECPRHISPRTSRSLAVSISSAAGPGKPPGRLEPVQPRHAHVHQHHVGLQAARGLHRLQPVGGLADNLDVSLRLQDHPEAGADQPLVVDHQNADHVSHRFARSVPRPMTCADKGRRRRGPRIRDQRSRTRITGSLRGRSVEAGRPLGAQRGDALADVRAAEAHELERERGVEAGAGEPAASLPATSRAVSWSRSSSTHSDTSPMRSASSPDRGSHSSRWYLALARPHSSGQTIPAWSPAATPSRVCPSMMRAPRAAMETSASRPTTRPAPTAGPAIADTTGLAQLTTL